mmetsp:Transcript_5932/g.8657  ORF Transcript_5932/g.8657 Transcript_5932/m.8657 type:complete len:458 (-) Transcript_5932:146-1519(-)
MLSRQAALLTKTSLKKHAYRTTIKLAENYLKQCSFRGFSALPSHEVVGMPSLSPTMDAGTIAKWNLAEGESFGAGDVIAEIQTDKATVDFEAQDDAVLAKILVSDPTKEVAVGEPIAIFVEDEADVAAFQDYQIDDAATPAPAAIEPEPEPVASPVASTPAVATPAPSSPVASNSSDGRIVASPLAHKLAKEMGIAIHSVPGTGPNGRIIADDVREFVPPIVVAAPESAAEPAAVAPMMSGDLDFADYALSADQVQKAAALTAQKQHVPHYYLTVDLDLQPILNLRSSSMTFGDVSVNAMLLKASICALKDCPVVNSRWMDSFVRMYNEVALEYVLPEQSIVINSAAGKGITEIDSIIAEPDEAATSSIGTFSVVNLGMYGVKAAAPIIRPGQSAILALGAAENRLVPSTAEDELYTTAVMATATLSCDHRVVDGAVGAQWLAAFKGYVEDPMSMLL